MTRPLLVGTNALAASMHLTLIITRPKKCLNEDIAFGTGRVHDDVGQGYISQRSY